MLNTITCEGVTFTVAKKQRPYSNDFVMLGSMLTQYEGQDEIAAIVKCTEDSKEAGRIYNCIYSMKGELVSCYC